MNVKNVKIYFVMKYPKIFLKFIRMLDKIRVLQECFSYSYLRKLIFIFDKSIYYYNGHGSVKGFISWQDNEITLLCVDPDYQNKGIAKRLIQKAKIPYVCIVPHNKKALRLYQSCGYHVKGYFKNITGIKIILHNESY